MTTQENRKKNILTEVISPDNVLHIAESLALRAVTSMLKFRAEGSNPIFVSNDIILQVRMKQNTSRILNMT